MKTHRCRCAALVLAVALLAAPLASAAPVAPTGGSWWSALAAGLGDLFGYFGDGILTITAEEGPGLEPDGNSSNLDGTLLPIDDGSNDADTSGPDELEGGALIDPNG